MIQLQRTLPLALISLCLSSFACSATAPRTGNSWVATRADATELKAARKICRTTAFDQTAHLVNDALAIKAGLGIFVSCMEQEGWGLQDQANEPKP